jgi:hypothetical protein
MATSREVVYDQYGNVINLILQVDGQNVSDHRVITRCVLKFGDASSTLSPDPYLTIDSSVAPGYFDFTDQDKLIIKLGAASVPKGRHNVTLIVYMPTYPTGLSFGPSIEVFVR